jgi:maltose alpha-D-glucosyltransferase/alpha-amylase
MSLPALSAAIAAWLPTARWFAGKGDALGGVAIVDACELPGSLVLALIDVAGGADTARYLVPVAAATGADAADTPAFAGWLLDLVARGGTAPGRAGTVVGHAAATPLSPDPAAPVVSPVGGDASNTSLRVGRADGTVVVKIFRRLRSGIQPEVEVGEFLAGRRGWTGTPPFRGWLEYVPHGPAGASTAVATVHDFLPGRETAWDLLLRLATAGDPAGAEWSRIRAVAASLGAATARMHAALAARTDVAAFAPEPATPATRRAEAVAMADRAAGVFARARQRTAGLPAPVAAAVQAVVASAAPLVARLRAAAETGGGAVTIRVHGDYHLGQVLLDPGAGDGAPVVIDFEGEPGRPLEDRRRKACAGRDVAGMCRSFDYLLRCAARAGGPAYDPQEAHRLKRAFLDAYRGLAADRSWWPADPAAADRLLAVLELDKAVAELDYELDHRPDWVEVPLAAIEDAVRYDAPPSLNDRRGRPA